MKRVKTFITCLALAAVVIGGAGLANGTTTAKAATKSYDETIVQTYQSSSSLINEPTVVCDGYDTTTLYSVNRDEVKPSNVIMYLDENMNVVERKSGAVIDPFEYVYEELDHNVISIVYVTTEAQADAFVSYMKNEMNILDIAVMSDKPELVKRVKKTHSAVRGIVDYRNLKKIDDIYTEIVKTTNENYANVAVLPQSLATKDTVEYVQARFKTVWVQADSTGTADLYDCINSGAYGVVSGDFKPVYNALESYPASYVRASFNVAHRALPQKYNENSISGTRAAIASGATHVELDGKLTTDGVIMMMHDDSIDRTTNGTDSIESMSYETARSYKLDLFGEETIPTLDEIMAELKGTGVVLVFEIKSVQTGLLPALKEAIERNDFYDQIVAISFHTGQLQIMKNLLPGVPTANLNTASVSTFDENLKSMGLYNTGVDTAGNPSAHFNEAYLRDRGIIGWYWTYSSPESVVTYMKKGYTGITNDVADTYVAEVKNLKGEDIYNVTAETAPAVGDKIALTVETYTRETKEVEGEIYYVEETENWYSIVATYTAPDALDKKPMFTQVIKAYKEGYDPNASEKSGCGSSIGVNIGGVLIVGAIATALAGLKRKKASR